MSLQNYLTSFVRMKRISEPDGLGGEHEAWMPEKVFQGGVTAQQAVEVAPGGLTAARTRTVLVHHPDIVLHPGDVVCRVFDAAQWRVIGSSDDMTMPRFAGTGYAQVPVERLVTAP